VGSQADHGLH